MPVWNFYQENMNKPLTPVNEALAQLLASIEPATATVLVDLASANGLVLAEDQVASVNVPAYNNSAMDGYVINTRDVPDAGTVLPVSQTIAAGHPGQPLVPGNAARIFTGAPIPEGGNAVVMQENTERVGESIRILELPETGQNIRLLGHDLKAGNLVLRAGRRLQPQDTGLLASLGTSKVRVMRPLTVAIINTGDEVVAPGQSLGPGQLYDSNSFTLAAMLEKLGIVVIRQGIVADSLAATEAALLEAAAQADCLITTGGVSVGEADYVREAVTRQGTLSLYKLAIKPGKPFSFGKVAGKPFFGLPGNPVAVFVTFLLLVKPALERMQGLREDNRVSFPARADFTNSVPGTRQEYLRVRLRARAGELPWAEPFSDQGSSLMSSISWADGLMIVPAGTTVKHGQVLEYLPFHGLL
jgi:molybdopterin molybdotransferase